MQTSHQNISVNWQKAIIIIIILTFWQPSFGLGIALCVRLHLILKSLVENAKTGIR